MHVLVSILALFSGQVLDARPGREKRGKKCGEKKSGKADGRMREMVPAGGELNI